MDKKLPLHQQEVTQPLLPTTDTEKGQSQQTTTNEADRQRKGTRALKLLIAVNCLLYTFSLYRRNELPNWLRWSQADVANVPASQWAVDSLLEGKRISHQDAEALYLSVPSPKSALSTAREFASVPHLAGSDADLVQAKTMLEIFQQEFDIALPATSPIFEAGSEASRNATLSIPTLEKPQAWIDTYFPIMNTPLERHLQVLDDDDSIMFDADVEEEEVEGDPAGKYAKTIGAWHGLSKGGDVKGNLVYANYGSKEDFDHLAAEGVDLTGTIVLVRYGGIFRGLKVKGAAEAGAVGCIIYSDPRDDGSVTVENGYLPYPSGPARNPNSVQRGSVQYLSKYPGDPSTPGLPAYPNATRATSLNVPTIPSLPISWNNAQHLLAYITLNSTWHYDLDGKKSAKTVRLNNQVHTDVIPIWNTMAVIPGHVRSEVVIVGCHRDAWVMGAADPISGTATLVEVIKGFGALVRKGWRPLKTIVFASWDAEEYGLIGSTEYGEDFPDFISNHVVAYLNTDVSARGSRFHIGGSPTLAHLLRQTAMDIPHPTDANRTLWDARLDSGKLTGPAKEKVVAFEELGADWQEEERRMREFRKPEHTNVSPLGSGSDYTVFLQRLGIASSDEGFGGTLQDPVYHYHSVYDSIMFQETYSDPGFVRHTAVAKHLGLVALRLVDAPLLPLNTTQYALELYGYMEKVQNASTSLDVTVDFSPLQKSIHKLVKASTRLDKSKAHAVHELEKAMEDLEKHRKKASLTHGGGGCGARSWPRTRALVKRVFGVTTGQHGGDQQQGELLGTPADNSTPLHHGYHLEHHTKHQVHHGKHHDKKPKLPKIIRRVMKAAEVVVAHNKKLSSFERGFIDEEGIKDREWYKNLVVAPGKWTGYGATTFPALSEAIEVERNATLAKYEVGRLLTLLDALADNLHVGKRHH